MDIWVKSVYGNLFNLSVYESVIRTEHVIEVYVGTDYDTLGQYKTEQRAKEVIQLIQDHINAIGTNNFNNLPMVYVMPIE